MQTAVCCTLVMGSRSVVAFRSEHYTKTFRASASSRPGHGDSPSEGHLDRTAVRVRMLGLGPPPGATHGDEAQRPAAQRWAGAHGLLQRRQCRPVARLDRMEVVLAVAPTHEHMWRGIKVWLRLISSWRV